MCLVATVNDLTKATYRRTACFGKWFEGVGHHGHHGGGVMGCSSCFRLYIQPRPPAMGMLPPS